MDAEAPSLNGPQSRKYWQRLSLFVAGAAVVGGLSFDMGFLVSFTAGAVFIGRFGQLLASYRQAREARLSRALQVVTCLSVFAVSLGTCQLKTKWLDHKIAPVISALDRFKEEHGQYPVDLNELVPSYVGELPSCPGHKLFYHSGFEEDRTRFVIGCVTYGFNKHDYDSARRRWRDWD